MQDRSRELPFIWPVNLGRLATLPRDVAAVLNLRNLEAAARRDVISSGWAERIDEGRFPAGSYEYGLQLDCLVGQKHPEVVIGRYKVENRLNHGIVQFLSTRGLRNLQEDLGRLANWKREATHVLFGESQYWH